MVKWRLITAPYVEEPIRAHPAEYFLLFNFANLFNNEIKYVYTCGKNNIEYE